MKKAVIVAFDHFTDVDVFLPWDLLNRVRTFDNDFMVKIVGTKDVHVSKNGIELKVHGGIEECETADIVFVGSGPEIRNLIKDEKYLSSFALNSKRQLICSMCSGSVLLASLGLLDGLSATTYPTSFEILRSYGVEVIEDKHLVTHGNIGTAAGCLAAIDLIGWALEKLYDTSVKNAVINSVMPLGQQTKNLN